MIYLCASSANAVRNSWFFLCPGNRRKRETVRECPMTVALARLQTAAHCRAQRGEHWSCRRTVFVHSTPSIITVQETIGTVSTQMRAAYCVRSSADDKRALRICNILSTTGTHRMTVRKCRVRNWPRWRQQHMSTYGGDTCTRISYLHTFKSNLALCYWLVSKWSVFCS